MSAIRTVAALGHIVWRDALQACAPQAIHGQAMWLLLMYCRTMSRKTPLKSCSTGKTGQQEPIVEAEERGHETAVDGWLARAARIPALKLIDRPAQ